MSENKVELAMKQENDMSTETTPIEVGTAWTMAQRLREEELAVIDDEDRAAEDFLKNGALVARSSGMAPIRNACGDCLLAKVEVAEDGKRSIVFAQKHDDGTVSASMRIGQVELFRYIQCLARKDRGNAEEQRQNRARARKIRDAVEDEYFSRYSSGEVLEIDEILAALAAACPSLPIEKKVASGISDDELYVIADTFFDGRAEGSEEMKEWKVGCQGVWYTVGRRNYYPLDDTALDRFMYYLKEQHGILMRKQEFLRKMKAAGYLYLGSSSAGYQAKIRVANDKTTWVYALYRQSFFNKRDQFDPEANRLESTTGTTLDDVI